MSTSQVIINDVKYVRYSVMDTHNTKLTHYWVDSKLVTEAEFNDSMRKNIMGQGGDHLILRALNAFRY